MCGRPLRPADIFPSVVVSPVDCTVVICTHNRAPILADTLAGLARVAVPPGGVELVLVDNASSDATAEVWRRHSNRFPFPVRYVYEERLGLSHARNRGIAEASGSVVAFLDDDAVPERDYVVGLLSVYERFPDAGCVGGRVILRWPDPPPAWWRPELDHHLSAIDLGDGIHHLRHPQCPVGANISFRRDLFGAGIAFDPTLGRVGKKLWGGEEAALCLEVERRGLATYYAPDSVVRHLAETSRANLSYLYRKSVLHGRSAARLERGHFDFEYRLRRATTFAVQGLVMALTARSVRQHCDWRYRMGYLWQTLAEAWS